MHILVLCLKLEENQLFDQSLHIGKMLIIYSSQKKCSKVGFCIWCCFMAILIILSTLRLYSILVGNNVVNCDRLQDPLGHGEHIHIWFPSTLLYCRLIKLNFLTHAML